MPEPKTGDGTATADRQGMLDRLRKGSVCSQPPSWGYLQSKERMMRFDDPEVIADVLSSAERKLGRKLSEQEEAAIEELTRAHQVEADCLRLALEKRIDVGLPRGGRLTFCPRPGPWPADG